MRNARIGAALALLAVTQLPPRTNSMSNKRGVIEAVIDDPKLSHWRWQDSPRTFSGQLASPSATYPSDAGCAKRVTMSRAGLFGRRQWSDVAVLTTDPVGVLAHLLAIAAKTWMTG